MAIKLVYDKDLGYNRVVDAPDPTDMYAPLTPDQRAMWKQKFYDQGQVVTDAQVDTWYNETRKEEQNRAANRRQDEALTAKGGQEVLSSGQGGMVAGREMEYKSADDNYFGENVVDLLGNTLWSALDTASFGVLGLGWEKAHKESFDKWNEMMLDSTGGRIGQGLGTALGFLAPMKIVGTGLKLAARGAMKVAGVPAKVLTKIPGAKRVGKTIEEINKGTTRGLQVQAQKTLQDRTAKLLKDRGGLTAKEAKNIIRGSTDDLMGFKVGFWDKRKGLLANVMGSRVMGGGKAYQMEHSAAVVAGVKQNMRMMLPGRLRNGLLKAGVPKGDVTKMGKELNYLADDLVEVLGKKPLNSIESMITSRFGHRIAKPLMKIAAASIQEAMNMGVTTILLDTVQKEKEDADRIYDPTHTWKDSFWDGARIGAMFGAVSFIPGGTASTTWKDAVKLMPGAFRRSKKMFQKMSTEELKAASHFNVMQSAGFRPKYKDGTPINKAMFLQPKALQDPASVQAMRKALVEFEYKKIRAFTDRGPGNWVRDAWKDFKGSMPRMGAGIMAMHGHEILGEDGPGLMGMLNTPEGIFHLVLSAFLTKRGRSLVEGKSAKWRGMEFGEKALYYDTKLAKEMAQMEARGIYMKGIKDMMPEFEVKQAASVAARAHNPDAEAILRILSNKEVMYKISGEPNEVKRVPTDVSARPYRPLAELVSPVQGLFKLRGWEVNPNATVKDQKAAYKAIRNLKSEVLSSRENDVRFESMREVEDSRHQTEIDWYLKLARKQLDNFDEQIRWATDGNISLDFGDRPSSSLQAKMPKLRFADIPEGVGGKKGGGMVELAAHDSWGELMDLRDNLINSRLLREESVSVEPGIDGIQIGKEWRVTAERDDWLPKLLGLKTIQKNHDLALGAEFFGEKAEMHFPHNDPLLWDLMKTGVYKHNVQNISDAIRGRNTGTIPAEKYTKIQNLITKILHPKNGNGGGQLDIVANVQHIIDAIDPTTVEAFRDIGNEKHLLRFLQTIHKIAATNRNPQAELKEPGSVDMADISQLHEIMTDREVGMPDFTADETTRFADWGRSVLQHSVREGLKGEDGTYSNVIVLSRLADAGLPYVHNDGKSNLPRWNIPSPRRMTVEAIRASGVSEAEAESIQSTYASVVKKLGKSVSHSNEVVPSLTRGQVNAILAADALQRPLELRDQYESSLEKMSTFIGQTYEAYEQLRVDKEQAPTDMLDQIQKRMNYLEEVIPEAESFATGYLASLQRVGADRQAAHLFWMRETKLVERYENLVKTDEFNFDGAMAEIKKIRTEISDKVNNTLEKDANMFSLHSDENVAADRGQELEGVDFNYNKNVIMPETFFKEWGIKDNAFGGDINHHLHNTHTQMLSELYDNTVKKHDYAIMPDGTTHKKWTADLGVEHPGVKKFTDSLFKAAGHTTETAPQKLRDHTIRLFNMFERQWKIKNVTINLESGMGAYTEGIMSKGPLTDLYSEIFINDVVGMEIFTTDYLTNSQNKQQLTDNQATRADIRAKLGAKDFLSVSTGADSEMMNKLRAGRITKGEPVNENTLKDISIGARYKVHVDENTALLLGDHHINDLSKEFIKWYDSIENTPYIEGAMKDNPATRGMMKELKRIRDAVDSISSKGKLNANALASVLEGGSKANTNVDRVTDALTNMFVNMYNSKIDGNWLGRMYEDFNAKWDKPKRLHQNRGYHKYSPVREAAVKQIYKNSDNEYYKELVDKYASKHPEVFTIDDSNVSEVGKPANDLITDARSTVEFSLNKNKRGFGEDDVAFTKQFMAESTSLNEVEAFNGATAASRKWLDFQLLKDGQTSLIGNSPGQKPVGVSNYTDANGRIHVWINKTHYFYDSRLDPFFERNPNIDQVALKSGAKKSDIIQPHADGNIQLFKPYGGKESEANIPTFKELEAAYDKFDKGQEAPKKQALKGQKVVTELANRQYMVDFINSINPKKKGYKDAVFVTDRHQMVSGVTYENHHNAKISKQLGNWLSPRVLDQLHRMGREDAARKFPSSSKKYYNPYNQSSSLALMKSFMSTESNMDNSISNEYGHLTDPIIMMENNAPPLGMFLKDTFDKFMTKRFLNDAGVMDGWTEAGMTGILRDNKGVDLDSPYYRKVGTDGEYIQIGFGESNVGFNALSKAIKTGNEYGIISPIPKGKLAKTEYRSASTQTGAFTFKGEDGHGTRDIMIDMKTQRVFDMATQKVMGWKEARAAGMGDIITKVERVRNKLGLKTEDKNGRPIKAWTGLMKELQLEGGDLIGAFQRSPKTGPHDLVINRIKKLLNQKDGNVVETNVAEVTQNQEGDHDTDKSTLMLDLPFDVLVETVINRPKMKESLPLEPHEKFSVSVDPANPASISELYANYRDYKEKRKIIIGAQRKIDQARLMFDILPNGLPLPNGKFIKFNFSREGITNLSTSGQRVLDVYKGFDKALRGQAWTDWFNNSRFGRFGRGVDDPLFTIVTKEGGSEDISPATNRVEVAILDKFMNDYSRLLRLESKVYEGGQGKTPRYTDFVSLWKDWKEEYHPKNITANYHSYVEKKYGPEVARDYFKDDQGNWLPFMDHLAAAVRRNPSLLERSLATIASKDYLESAYLRTIEGNDFGSTVLRMQARGKAELARYLEIEGSEAPADWNIDKAETLISNEWSALYEGRKAEEILSQTEVIKEQIDRSEYALEHDKGGLTEADKVSIGENIAVKRKSLDMLMGKMTLDPEFNKDILKQTFIKFNKNKPDLTHSDPYNKMAVRRASTGKFVKYIEVGDPYSLSKGEVLIKNPIEIIPHKEYDWIDRAAVAQTLLGAQAKVLEPDRADVSSLIHETQKEVRTLDHDFYSSPGIKNHDSHRINVRTVIEKGLQKIQDLSLRDADQEPGEMVQTWYGLVPMTKSEYGHAYLMGLLTSTSGSGNKFHFLQNTGKLVPAYNAPSKTMVKEVFGIMKHYEVVPNWSEWLGQFSRDYRSHTELLLAGGDFHTEMKRIQNSTFEGSIIGGMIDKAYNNPFLPPAEFKTLGHYMETLPDNIPSQFADLFSQMIHDKRLVDPATAMHLRNDLINETSPETYANLFRMKKGEIYMADGLAQTYPSDKGEGIFMGHLVGAAPITKYGLVMGVPVKEGQLMHETNKLEAEFRRVLGDSQEQLDSNLNPTCK